jgi:hypothetical protein
MRDPQEERPGVEAESDLGEPCEVAGCRYDWTIMIPGTDGEPRCVCRLHSRKDT